MVHMGAAETISRVWSVTTFEDRPIANRHSVLVVRDPAGNSNYLDSVCEFLDIKVNYATTDDDLGAVLSALHPIAVIADLDGKVQDGFHVMKVMAGHNPVLPILLLTDNDPALLGATDAVREVWGLTRVTTAAVTAGIGVLVDFICCAARDAGKPRLMRV